MKARWRVLPTLTALTLLGPWLSAGSAQDAPQTPREPLQLWFGVNIRERVESNHAEFLGTVPGDSGEWLLQRLELLADLRLGSHIRVIAQMQSALGPGKQILIPVDRDPLDLEQAFIAITEPVAGGTLVVRVGRSSWPSICSDLCLCVTCRICINPTTLQRPSTDTAGGSCPPRTRSRSRSALGTGTTAVVISHLAASTSNDAWRNWEACPGMSPGSRTTAQCSPVRAETSGGMFSTFGSRIAFEALIGTPK